VGKRGPRGPYKKREAVEVAVEVIEQLPEELQAMLQRGAVRSLDDVTDITAMFTRLIAEQTLPTRLSKEVRLWTELMFSSVAAKNATPQNEVNVIGQLIQAVNVGGKKGTAAPRQIDEVIDVEALLVPTKKAMNG